MIAILLAAVLIAADARPEIGVTAVAREAMRADLAVWKVKVPTYSGVLLSDVTPGGPAEDAGLKRADLVTRIGDTTIRTPDDYLAAVAALQVGTAARVWFRRRTQSNTWDTRQTEITPATFDQVEQLRKAACPLEILDGSLRTNVIGLPEVRIRVQNRSPQRVLAYSVDVECYDRFDAPVKDLRGSNVYGGIDQDPIAPRDKSAASWQLSLHVNTAVATVTVVRVRMADGTEWRLTTGRPPQITLERQ